MGHLDKIDKVFVLPENADMRLEINVLRKIVNDIENEYIKNIKTSENINKDYCYKWSCNH